MTGKFIAKPVFVKKSGKSAGLKMVALWTA